MRGKVVSAAQQKIPDRITPAYAGKRSELVELLETLQDHPRLCGEKVSGKTPWKNAEGSPPPMRGKGELFWFVHFVIGITPAYAGKSSEDELKFWWD